MAVATLPLPELWHNTFSVGRPTSDVWRLSALGEAHLATACLIRDGFDGPVETLPSYRMFAGPAYGKLIGRADDAASFSHKYLGAIQQYMRSFQEHGYDPKRSRLTALQLDDGTWRMIDGHRRIAIMMALGCGPMIEVKVGDYRFTGDACRKRLDLELPKSPFKVDGKPVLYEPIRGFDEYNAPSRTATFEDALQTVLKITGDPKGQRFLDVGSCFGWFSFGLVKRGAFCTGLEIDPGRRTCCRQLAACYGMDWSNPIWPPGEVEVYLPAAHGQNLDWVLMMSVFHVLWRKNKAKATETLRLAVRRASRGVILSMDHRGACSGQPAVGDFLRGLLPNTSVEEAGKACGRIVHVLGRKL